MGEKNRHQGGVPERLKQKTIETVPLEAPYVVESPQFGSLREVLTIDEGTERLMIDAREVVRPLRLEDLSRQEDLVIVMRALVCDGGDGGDRRSVEGLIADVRWCNERFYVSTEEDREVDFTDQEGAWGQIDARQHEELFVSVIAHDEDGEIAIWGDPRFYDAAMHLVELVDEYCDSGCDDQSADVAEEGESSVMVIERNILGDSGEEAMPTEKTEPAHRKIARAVLGRLFGGRPGR